MTPARDSGKYILDRRFRHVGRIKRSSGTSHLPTFRRIDEMLSGLYERGKFDVLKAIQKGTYSPLEVYDAYRVNELERLPTAASLAPLEPAFNRFISDKECSDAHRRSLSQSLRHILSVARVNVTVGELPALITLLRVTMKAGKHPRSFNLAKAAAQAFIRSMLKRSHPLWHDVSAIEGLRVTPQRTKHPLTPEEFNTITDKMESSFYLMAWSMAATGMGASEYWGRWSTEKDRIRIRGTKRAARDRFVPLCGTVSVSTTTYREFREALSEASDGTVTPYDLRRSFANWLESSGIPRTRRRLYLGHGARDVTDLYEQHEVSAFLKEDAERLRKYVFGEEAAQSLRLVKESA